MIAGSDLPQIWWMNKLEDKRYGKSDLLDDWRKHMDEEKKFQTLKN